MVIERIDDVDLGLGVRAAEAYDEARAGDNGRLPSATCHQLDAIAERGRGVRSMLRQLVRMAIFVGVALVLTACCGKTATPQKVGESGSAPPPQQQPQPPQKFKVGDVIEIGKLRFTVNGVREDEGSEFLRPPQGKRWLVVDATIENLSDQPATISSLLMFKLSDADGYRYTVTIGPDLKGHPGGELAPGSWMRGEVAFEVPKDAGGLELIFEPNLFGFGQAIVVLGD